MGSVNEDARNELEAIRNSNGGLLEPSAVVAAAKNKNSSLHKYFTWDNKSASEAYRLEQAKNLIRCVVRHLPSGDGDKVISTRMYISLPSDRKAGRGYRAVEDILTDSKLMAEALRDIERTLMYLEKKYSTFSQIQPLLSEMTAVLKRSYELNPT